jgi:hypothetical protein
VKAWNAIEALSLINELWEVCQAAGYHIALTGSLLKRGYSTNDCDLVLYPRHSLHTDYRPVVAIFKQYLNALSVKTVLRPKDSDYKLVITLTMPDKRRLELFFPNFAFEGRLDTFETVETGASSCEDIIDTEVFNA